MGHSLVIYINLTRNMDPNLTPMQAILVEMPLLLLTAFLVIYLFKEIFKKTLHL